jgi:TRAP-type C4-dicarboxylate transport system permease small subunit
MVAATQANQGRFFGVQFGDFGLFATILLSFSLGFLAFFATCFVAIFGILIYNSAGHHNMNLADSYRYFALPVGLAVLAISLIALLGFWLRRKLSNS